MEIHKSHIISSGGNSGNSLISGPPLVKCFPSSDSKFGVYKGYMSITRTVLWAIPL